MFDPDGLKYLRVRQNIADGRGPPLQAVFRVVAEGAGAELGAAISHLSGNHTKHKLLSAGAGSWKTLGGGTIPNKMLDLLSKP